MCLSIAMKRPGDILATGEHCGLKWHVIHNGSGYRCGYVRVPVGHPWHGKHYDDVNADVHGGLTFAQPAVPCDNDGADAGHWFGFDCAHAWDAPDQTLPNATAHRDLFRSISDAFEFPAMGESIEVRSQEYVEAECRRLCEQAHAAAI